MRLASAEDFIQQRLHLDLLLLLQLLLLSAVGLLVLYSASNQDMEMIQKQVSRLALAFLVMVLLAQIPPAALQRWSLSIFTFATILLMLVLLLGTIGKGAQRWLDLGLVRLQPSEFMKLAVPMVIAWYLHEKPLPPWGRHTLVSALFCLLPTLLILKQPDLGTALLIASSGVFVLLFAGLQWHLIGVLSLLLLPSVYLFWIFGMHDYQRQRVMTLFNPESDPLGSGYHIIQSKIAIGSGGVFGKGWLNGTQSHLEFLPERHTDFIFAVFCEEFGLFGVILLLILYLTIVLRGLYIASQAQTTFARLLGGALAMTFLIYVSVNIGMVIGLLPVVGLPLPLISYGGSSIVTLMASFGILMSIHTHRKLLTNA
ncbi:MAG: rod shape-determining protein RodA [Gammaproteobacteria bacterium]|nr:rod shape-determining protein RodA [Gammaproteobacteria bacterium]